MNISLRRLAALGALSMVLALAPTTSVGAAVIQPSSSADATHSLVMAEAAQSLQTSDASIPNDVVTYSAMRDSMAPNAAIRTTAAMPPLQREVFGFAFGNRSLGDPTYGYPGWNFGLLTTIAYFGLNIDWDGTIIPSGSGWSTWNSTQLTGLISTAHAHHVRVILSLNLHNFNTDPKSAMCAALHPTHRAVTINQAIAQITKMHADGINFDYEGNNTVCAYQVGTTQYGKDLREEMADLVAEARAKLPNAYLAVDTYSGSAHNSTGFFDIPNLAKSVDSIFVMAYDMEYSNWAHAPLSCTRMCMGPTSPVSTYFYNDTKSMAQYIADAGASKVILGVPYYGRKGCVAGVTPSTAPAHAYPAGGALYSDGYLDASTENGYVYNSQYKIHRDSDDLSGRTRWDAWYSSQAKCTREMYWDDVYSLGKKYDLVNRDNVRGVGIWALQYGGNAPELWDTLASHFTKPYALVAADATQATTAYTVTEGAYYGGVISSFDVMSYDVTAGTGWFTEAAGVPALSGGANTWTATTTVYGFQGHHYQYRVRAHSYSGLVSPWSDVIDSTVSPTATESLPHKGLYTLRPDGYLMPNQSPPVATWQYWKGQNMARAVHPLPGPGSPSVGAVLTAHGSLVSYGQRLVLHNSAYWPTQDLARDFAFLPDGTGGYVLDAHGNLWPFAVNANPMPPAIHGNTKWPSLDIARKIVIFDDGKGGYVMDYTGVVNPFAIGANPLPARPTLTRRWPGNDFARDIVLIPGTRSGYVMNGYAGLYPFTAPGETTPVSPAGAPYWSGHNVARGFFLLPGSTAAAPGGYILDCAAGLTPWGNAPAGSGVSGSWACGMAKAITGG